MKNVTRFAWVMDEAAPGSGDLWDQEILRTDRFVVLPSAGSLVAGWTLVVPRTPMINLAGLDDRGRAELDSIIEVVADSLATSGHRIYCFEHGAGWSGSATGCGVDQAHLHIVPLPFDLRAAARARTDGAIDWRSSTSEGPTLAQLPSESEYVALWSADEGGPMIGAIRRPVSQWIRRVIADELGVADEWDYRNHPQTQNITRTLEMFAPLGANPAA
jgi:diadenosine tetraphosphate (Ap4A) HIT family hydrolase